MHFQSVRTATVTPSAAPESSPRTRTAAEEVAQNLLKHIPAESSGFYLMAVASFEKPSLGTLGGLFVLALVLLVLVRWLAQASFGIWWTTLGAYGLWMLVLDQGFLHQLLEQASPGALPDPWGLILAGFYSAVVTILASAGKIR